MRFVTEPENILFAGVRVCAIFCPEVLKAAGAVKGLINRMTSVCAQRQRSQQDRCMFSGLTDVPTHDSDRLACSLQPTASQGVAGSAMMLTAGLETAGVIGYRVGQRVYTHI